MKQKHEESLQECIDEIKILTRDRTEVLNIPATTTLPLLNFLITVPHDTRPDEAI
jgi:hypothetical protein